MNLAHSVGKQQKTLFTCFGSANIPGHFGKKPTVGYAKMLMALKTTPCLQPYVLAKSMIWEINFYTMYFLSLGITYTFPGLEIPYPSYKYMQKNPELDGN